MDIEVNTEKPLQIRKCPETGCEFKSQYAYSLLCHKIIHDVLKVINPDLASTLLGSNFGIVEQDPVQFKLPEEKLSMKLSAIPATCCIDSSEISMSPTNSDSSHVNEIDQEAPGSGMSRNLPVNHSRLSLTSTTRTSVLGPEESVKITKRLNPEVMLGSNNPCIKDIKRLSSDEVEIIKVCNKGLQSNSYPHSSAKKRGRKPRLAHLFTRCDDRLNVFPTHLTSFGNTAVSVKEASSSSKKVSSKRLLKPSQKIVNTKRRWSSTADNSELPKLLDHTRSDTMKTNISKHGTMEKMQGQIQTQNNEESTSSKSMPYKKVPRIKRSIALLKRRSTKSGEFPTTRTTTRKSSTDSRERSPGFAEVLEAQPFNSFDLTKLNAYDITNQSRRAQYEYVCIICKKFMKYRHHFIYHAISHSGERPFACNFCNKSYTQHHNLMVHLKKSHMTEVTSTFPSKTEHGSNSSCDFENADSE